MQRPTKMLQNLPYFWNTNFPNDCPSHSASAVHSLGGNTVARNEKKTIYVFIFQKYGKI